MANFNVCYGCRDVENVVKCLKTDCSHYGDRDKYLELDHERNKMSNIMVAENNKSMLHGRPIIARLGGSR